MNSISKPERATQNRLVGHFRDHLGYRYLGDWSRREKNSNVEEEVLRAWLTGRGHGDGLVSRAIEGLKRRVALHGQDLYDVNRETYSLLRYGVKIREKVGEVTETVHLIDWANPEANDFAIAEEVRLDGELTRRPDLVLFVNGIAVGVIELKNSRSSVNIGIRQSLSNQMPEFNAWFFTTVQFIMAGNDFEGMKYGTTKTPDKFFTEWKEDRGGSDDGYRLDRHIEQFCRKDRIIEMMRDFVLFDGGIKKLPRPHQYFAIRSAQEFIGRREGGIIWHTQGSGKSIVMVLLARWILENLPNARVAVITDRDELDKQIERVFRSVGEEMVRAESGRDLMDHLGKATPRLLCSLVHKFGASNEKEYEKWIRELEASPSKAVGDLFIFVDECHRTQSGRLHRAMKAMLPNAVFIGFTGTPLLKEDKGTSREVFGRYIHTYKFDEGVEDGIILDLRYENRDIDQKLSSPERIDAWFEAKTKGLNSWQQDELKKRWGTLQRVLGSKSRMERVVNDILFDFSIRPRLDEGTGNAILVAASIFEACRYYTLFQETEMKGRCAVVTSYNPNPSDVSLEETGANTETEKQILYNTYRDLLADVEAAPGKSKTETYEDRVKKLFSEEPGRMKLLIVVDKLLTGYDAPPCTFLYIDKAMRDHGLFQAICRTNRLDDESKVAGFIVDYKDLFHNVENAIAVYTSELAEAPDGTSSEVLMRDRLKEGREELDLLFEKLEQLCEPVEPPKDDLQYIRYFCGNPDREGDLADREPLRVQLYRLTASLVRAYANIADELGDAGYSTAQIERLKRKQKEYVDLRAIVRQASGEELDLKPFEADMRHLIDRYIEASEPRKISPFDDVGLIDLIVKTGINDAIAERLQGMSREAVAETIENNVRSTIIKSHLSDPAFYAKMSELLEEIIRARREKAIEYEEYLRRIAELARQAAAGTTDDTPEAVRASPGLRAIYNALKSDAESVSVVGEPGNGAVNDPHLYLAETIHRRILEVRHDRWRGVLPRENRIKQEIYEVMKNDAWVERLFAIIMAQNEY